MSVFFPDTSALAKRYIEEIGSQWVRSWTDPATGNTIIISELTTVELVSALARRRRESVLSTADFIRLRNEFWLHVDTEYIVINIYSSILTDASLLVSNYSLRTLDAIQLATALYCTYELGIPHTFVSADRNLLTAAASEGLQVDNPNNYP